MNVDTLGYVVIETGLLDGDLGEAPEPKIIKSSKDRVVAEGILQEANMKNRNGRYYDSRDLFPELTCPRTIELLSTGNMKAENGHPMSKDLTRQQTIDPNNTVAVFQKFWTDGDFVMGRYMGDENDKGEYFDRELRKGRKPSWSLRALGTIKNTARGAEVKNIKIITYDRVIFPSHDKAYTTRLVSESSDMVVKEGSKVFVTENDKGMLFPISNDDVIRYVKEESASFKTIKESFDLLYDDMQLINGGKQVQMTDRAGSVFVLNLESYIHDEIMNDCVKRMYR